MPNEIDRCVEQGAKVLYELFSKLELSEDERKFVNDAGRKIAEYSFSLLTADPDRAAKLRPVVMAAAIATIIGPDPDFLWPERQ